MLKDSTDSSGDEEFFSDASEGIKVPSRPTSPFHSISPIPRTRVEKVDDKPSYGEVPGSPAYNKRLQDSVPDEVEIVPEGRLSKRGSRTFLDTAVSPGGSVIPRTVVEKVDPASPSHGDIPGTPAYEQRLADAAPDVVLKAPEPGKRGPVLSFPQSQPEFPEEGPVMQIPETVITRFDSNPDTSPEIGTRPSAAGGKQ